MVVVDFQREMKSSRSSFLLMFLLQEAMEDHQSCFCLSTPRQTQQPWMGLTILLFCNPLALGLDASLYLYTYRK